MDALKSDVLKNSVSSRMMNNTKADNLKDVSKDSVTQKSDVKKFSMKNLLDSLFKDLTAGVKSKDTILQILREKNIPSSIKYTTVELKSLIDSLKESKVAIKTMDGLLLNIEKLDGKNLEAHIKQSGIFLESKLANLESSKSLLSLQTLQNPKEEIVRDIKANLLQIKDDFSKSGDMIAKDMMPKIDRVLTNINYYQLLSYSMGASILYLPLLWDGLEEGQVSIKKLKQKRFFCEINLKLKEFGKLDLFVMLFDDIDINISIFTQNDEFLSRIRENLQLLRRAISSVGLVSSNIYLYDSLKDERRKKETKEYVQAQQIGSGISLYV